MGRFATRIFVIGFALYLSAANKSFASLGDVLPGLADLQRWSIFALGDDTRRSELSGGAFIEGDVGVAGLGAIALKDDSTIQGDLYYRSNGGAIIGPNATVTGSQIGDQDVLLDNEAAAALTTSQQARNLKRTYFTPTSLELEKNQNFVVTGAPGGTVVLKLENFVLSGDSTFTLQGTATTTFVINITKQFALSDRASIALSGGIEWSNVLFNICGKDGAVSLSGNSSFAGILMANRRTIHVSDGSTVDGELLGNRVVLRNSGFSSGARVGHPPLASP